MNQTEIYQLRDESFKVCSRSSPACSRQVSTQTGRSRSLAPTNRVDRVFPGWHGSGGPCSRSLDGEVMGGQPQPTARPRSSTCTPRSMRSAPEFGSVVHTTFALCHRVRSRSSLAGLLCRSPGSAGQRRAEPGRRMRAERLQAAVGNIVSALREGPGQRAVLLANHGILAFSAERDGYPEDRGCRRGDRSARGADQLHWNPAPALGAEGPDPAAAQGVEKAAARA